MKPRRTPTSTDCFRLEGGTEDNDLWVERDVSDGLTVLHSVWELTAADRERIAAGEDVHVRLSVFGAGHPPVMVTLVDTPLGKGSS